MPLTMRTITAREWAPDGTVPLEGKFTARIAQGATKYLGQGILDGRREWRTNGGVATILLPDSLQAGLDPDPYYILTFRPYDKEIPARTYGPFLLTGNATLDQLPTLILELAPPGGGGGGTPGTLTDAEIQTLIAQSRDRANHNGVNDDPIGTVFPDFLVAVRDVVWSVFDGPHTNITFSRNATTGEITATASGGGGTGTLDAEGVRDAVKLALRGIEGITVNEVTTDDAADTITIGVSGFTIDQITGLQAALDLKAPKSSPAFTGTPTLNGTPLATTADIPATPVDLVKSLPGLGGYTIVPLGMPGATPTGGPNEIILGEPTVVTPGGGASVPPPGLDVVGGIVGCTVSDPAMAVPPATTDTEATGSVLVAVANNRVGARARVMSGTRIDRVTWHVGDGSTASVTGFIAIARSSDGVILAQNNAQALTPATITAGVGSTQNWNLATPITGLTAGDELVVLTWHGTGTIRYTARGGITGLTNVSALRTFASGSGDLHRAGVVPGLTSAPTSPVDFTAAAAWVKRPLAIFVLSRTS